MGLFGLALLVWLAYRGWSILLLAPGALIAAAFRGRTATRLLDADFHGHRFAFCRAVLPTGPCSARFSAS
jgi:hypothetical protein